MTTGGYEMDRVLVRMPAPEGPGVPAQTVTVQRVQVGGDVYVAPLGTRLDDPFGWYRLAAHPDWRVVDGGQQ